MVIDLQGKRFGRLVVLRDAGNIPEAGRPSGRHAWFCRCDCGNERTVLQQHLRSGKSLSCGCLQIESATKHGEYESTEYRIWVDMKARCFTPSHGSYEHYGGRGIEVCRHWVNSFPNFLRDMGRRPSKHLSIDRVDNAKGYLCPACLPPRGNCHWATEKEQQNNTRKNRRLTLDGETKTLAQWAESAGLSRTTLTERLRHGWSLRDAITSRE
jgi:hypothetical protein